MSNDNLLLEVKGLKKYFPLNKDFLGRPRMQLHAVDNVSFKLEAGKTIGVVGESGCGKTTLGRTILQLYDTTGGKSIYYGHKLEEFNPNYYLKDLNNLPKFKSKIDSLYQDLEKYKDMEELTGYSELLYFNTNVTLEEIKKAAEKISRLASKHEGELAHNLNKAGDTLGEIYNLYEKCSAASGCLCLGNINRAREVLLAKAKLLIKYNKNKTLGDELNELESLKAEVKTLIESITPSTLKDSLQNNLELGLDLARLTKPEMRRLRTEIQLIFQDPYSSLPPRMTVGEILSEAVKVHSIVPKNEVNAYIHDVMSKCGLQRQYYDRYPHEFSGGQRQRICIARALAVNPRLVICDEPVSALDVSIQAQIINLLKDLQRELGLTYIFISHDLSVVKYITDNILVMYLGNMMEIGDTDDIFKHPLHPYTQALFSAVPNPDPDSKMERITLQGDIPSPANPPKGCKFHTRCNKCMSVCKLHAPKNIEYEPNHVVACHLYDEEVMANLSEYDEELRLKEEKAQEALEAKKAQTPLENLKDKITGCFKK